MPAISGFARRVPPVVFRRRVDTIRIHSHRVNTSIGFSFGAWCPADPSDRGHKKRPPVGCSERRTTTHLHRLTAARESCYVITFGTLVINARSGSSRDEPPVVRRRLYHLRKHLRKGLVGTARITHSLPASRNVSYRLEGHDHLDARARTYICPFRGLRHRPSRHHRR